MEEVTNQGESSHSGGEQGSPNPDASQETDVQPTSFDAKAVVTALQDNPEFLSMLERQTQSVKDRRFNKLEGQMGNFEEQLATYEDYRKGGKTPEEARREMKIDRLIADETVPVEPQQQPGTQPVAPSAPELDEFFKEFGVDPSGPEATQLIRDGKTDFVSLARFAVQRDKSQSEPPNPAQVMPVGTGSTASGKSADEIRDELIKVQNTAPMNFAEQRRLNSELTKALARG